MECNHVVLHYADIAAGLDNAEHKVLAWWQPLSLSAAVPEANSNCGWSQIPGRSKEGAKQTLWRGIQKKPDLFEGEVLLK